MKKSVIHINNCPIHLVPQVMVKVEEFCTVRGFEPVDNLEDADVFIIVTPVFEKIVFAIDNTKLRGTTSYIVDLNY